MSATSELSEKKVMQASFLEVLAWLRQAHDREVEEAALGTKSEAESAASGTLHAERAEGTQRRSPTSFVTDAPDLAAESPTPSASIMYSAVQSLKDALGTDEDPWFDRPRNSSSSRRVSVSSGVGTESRSASYLRVSSAASSRRVSICPNLEIGNGRKGSSCSLTSSMRSPSSVSGCSSIPERMMRRRYVVSTRSTTRAGKFDLRAAWTPASGSFCDEDDTDFDFAVVPVSTIRRSSLMLKSLPSSHSLGAPACLFGSQSVWRRYMEIVGFLLLLYEVCFIPIQVAFQPPSHIATTILEYVSSLFWTLDILVTFNCGYVNQLGHEVVDRRLIALRYLKTWFFVDLATVLPDWIFMMMHAIRGPSSSMSIGNITGVLRALRLLRLQKMSRILSVFQQRMNSAYLLTALQTWKLVSCLVYIIHVLACLWYMVGKMDAGAWIARYDLVGRGDLFLYASSLFWSLTQFHGTSGINPGTTFELFFSSVVGLLTMLGFSSFLSKVTNMMIDLSRTQEKKTLAARLLNEYLDRNQVSTELSVRAKMCLNTLSKGEAALASLDDIGLSKQLIADIKEEAISPILRLHPLFSAICDMHARCLRHLCHEACEQIYYAASSTVFILDDPCDSMIIQTSGRTTYCRSGQAEEEAEEICKSEWFAEACLWVVWVHRGDLKAVSPTHTLSVSAAAFSATIDLFIAFLGRSFFSTYATMYLQELMDHDDPTDRVHFAIGVNLPRQTRRSIASVAFLEGD